MWRSELVVAHARAEEPGIGTVREEPLERPLQVRPHPVRKVAARDLELIERRRGPGGRSAPVNGSGTKTCLCHDARIREQLICRGVESISLVREGGGKGA